MPGVISRLLGAPRALEVRTAEELAAHLRGSGRTWSGIDVTPDNALHVSAFFYGVRIIAEDIGKLPFIVYPPPWRVARACHRDSRVAPHPRRADPGVEDGNAQLPRADQLDG